jgi:hypothetical protein
MPFPVQLSRRAGWRMPPNTVTVARPSRWGNPWRVFQQKAGTLPGWYVQREHSTRCDGPFSRKGAESIALRRFEAWARRHQAQIARELGGRNLGCWCPLPKDGRPDRCHRSILLRLANHTEATP